MTVLLGQITDTHVKDGGRPAYGGIVDTTRCLRDAVAHFNAFRPKLDAVLVTGDLVDRGTPEEYATLRPLLDALEMPFYVVPGNHDDRDSLRAAFADHPWLAGHDGFIQYVIEDHPVRLIGLDSVDPGRGGGTYCPTRMDWLEARLSEGPDRPTLLFLHHPPFEVGIGHMDCQNLDQGEALMALLGRFPQVLYLACGHVHRASETVIHGVPVGIAPSPAHAVTLDLNPGGSASFTLEPVFQRILRIVPETGRVVSHLTPVGTHSGPHPFFDGEGRLVD